MEHRNQFDKFTERARKVLVLSQQEALRLHSPIVGTNHLLLGLLREGEGIAAKALEEQNIDLKKTFTEIAQITATEHQDDILTNGVLENSIQGAGLLRHEHALPGGATVYVPQAQIEQHNLQAGDIIFALVRSSNAVDQGKNYELLSITAINGADVSALPAPEGPPVTGSIGLSSQAKHSVTLAVEEAKNLKHHYLGTEHMLLGLIREERGLSASILRLLGVEVEKTRSGITDILSRPK
jgi:ATP-dependent Clp protease ATP-binding subunit ClpA